MAPADQQEITTGALKAASAWGAVAITSWTDIAAALAAIYSVLLIIDLWWRRIGRGWAEHIGWVKPRKRRRTDTEDEP
jgi:hypothetical protein